VGVETLKPHPRNYKTHPEDQLLHLGASLRQNGVYKNVVIARDGTILAGYGVVEAAKKVGIEQIPVRRLDVSPDSARAVSLLAKALDSGAKDLPPMHFATGAGITMRQLAEIAVSAGGGFSRIVLGTSRDYDVSKFVGDPSRAERVLGWRASKQPREGVAELVRAFQAEALIQSAAS